MPSPRRRDKVVATEKSRADTLEGLLADEKRGRTEADIALAASQERIARLEERVEQLRSRTAVLKKRLEQRQRRIVILKKQVDRLQRRMVALSDRAGVQAAARSTPTSTHAKGFVRVGRRLAARARAGLNG
jgi:predicted RNase H-like nuclease (RuvC/YqgF family)